MVAMTVVKMLARVNGEAETLVLSIPFLITVSIIRLTLMLSISSVVPMEIVHTGPSNHAAANNQKY